MPVWDGKFWPIIDDDRSKDMPTPIFELLLGEAVNRVGQILSPALDIQAPYAKVMIREVAKVILELADTNPGLRMEDSVPLPRSADMAQMMYVLGYSYLKEHAPERLREGDKP